MTLFTRSNAGECQGWQIKCRRENVGLNPARHILYEDVTNFQSNRKYLYQAQSEYIVFLNKISFINRKKYVFYKIKGLCYLCIYVDKNRQIAS